MSGTRTMINGIDLYHEVHGTGRPLVVLHGGVMNAATPGAGSGLEAAAGAGLFSVGLPKA